MCATTPLSLEIVIRYILNVDEQVKDKETIAMTIQRCSLLLSGAEEEGRANIRVHHIVSDVIESLIRDFPKTHQLQTVDAAVSSFIQFVEDDLSIEWLDLDSFKYSKHLLPHLKTLITKSEHLFHERDISQEPKRSKRNVQNYRSSFQKLGKMCLVHAVLDAAIKYFGLTLQFAQLVEEYNHDKHVADCYSNLAEVHRRLGDLEQAKQYNKRALTGFMKMVDPENVDVARCYNNLAAVHLDLYDLEQAKEYQESALAIHLKKLGHEHLYVADCYTTMAGIYRALGNLEEAKEYYYRALAIRLKKLDPDHLDVASCYSNLGLVDRALGNLEQAKEYYDRALTIRLKKLDPDHPDVATCYSNLGSVNRALGNLEQAKDYHDRAFAILLEKLDPDHRQVSIVQHELTQLQHMMDSVSRKKHDHHSKICTIL